MAADDLPRPMRASTTVIRFNFSLTTFHLGSLAHINHNLSAYFGLVEHSKNLGHKNRTRHAGAHLLLSLKLFEYFFLLSL
jgi:hypothetical protein